MTVSTQTTQITYTGDGATTVFAFGFKAVNSADITVYIDGAELFVGVIVTLNADQEITPGGSVEITPAPAVDAEVKIKRETPRTQPVDYEPYGPFPADTHEGALDRLTLLVQEVETDLTPKLEWVAAPASASDTGTAGQLAYDSDYLYVCVATDTWKRVALEAW